MQSLLTRLKILSKTGYITSSAESCSVAKLIVRAVEIRQNYPQLANHQIALKLTNLTEFITALIAFDGWCAALYLCPPDMSPPSTTDVIQWPIENKDTGQIYTNPANNHNAVHSSAWFLATSGTTGQPKWYSHTFASLTASTKCSEKLQTMCWVLLYQPFRYAGLQVVLQALLSGADLVDAADLEPLEQVARIKQTGVNAISTTPSLWRQLLMTGQLNELCLRHITLGGEIADQSILDKLKAMFPQAKLRHIYASTESGVGIVVSDGLAGFPVKWLNDSKMPVCLKVSDKQQLLVKPPFNICPRLAEKIDSQGFYDTQDKVEKSGSRVLFVGRATGIINVGGNKVYPEKIEQVLLQCADINHAKVYPKKSPLMGELVVADVTIKPGADQQQTKMTLMRLSKNQLQRFEIPTKINIVEKIVQDPSGKINRKQ